MLTFIAISKENTVCMFPSCIKYQNTVCFKAQVAGIWAKARVLDDCESLI